jgi:hypothetical protein
MKLLVTGSSGLIGSGFVACLLGIQERKVV